MARPRAYREQLASFVVTRLNRIAAETFLFERTDEHVLTVASPKSITMLVLRSDSHGSGNFANGTSAFPALPGLWIRLIIAMKILHYAG